MEVDLAAVVGFVFDHGSQPLPGRDLASRRGVHPSRQIVWRHRSEQLVRLLVHLAQIGQDRLVPLGEGWAVSGIAAGAAEHVLGEHPAFGGGEMSQEIAEAPSVRCGSPFDLVRRYETSHSESSVANAIEVREETHDVVDLH